MCLGDWTFYYLSHLKLSSKEFKSNDIMHMVNDPTKKKKRETMCTKTKTNNYRFSTREEPLGKEQNCVITETYD